ncbi:MAG: FG-GAP-like repeat-containing protein [Myxococcota bacterium]|nr:FG-GAP-like repeat-containing protein [Myxococcota bacterium]
MRSVTNLVLLVLMTAVGCQESSSNADAPVADAQPDQTVETDGQVTPPVDAGDQVDAIGPMPDLGPAVDMEIRDQGSADSSLAHCEPALELSAPQRAARPYDLVRFIAGGGTGQWRFTIENNASGALLNETTGTYLAGETVGQIDTILLTDDGCLGEARIEMRVVETMLVLPSEGEVGRGGQFTFEVRGGSNSFEFTALSMASGGEITLNGDYTAGDRDGLDRIRVTDAETGQSQDIELAVIERVELQANPNTLFVPLGSSIPLSIDGGTGHFVVENIGDGIRYENGVFTGLRAGAYELAIRDRFADVRTPIRLTVVESLQANIDPFDDGRTTARTISPGDLNGDGLADLVIAMESADVNAGNSGAVFVYLADETGYSGQPDQVLSGFATDDQFGRDVAFGDLNGDGMLDLVVGAAGYDPGLNNAGGLFIYYGTPNGLFSPQPDDVLSGVRGDDNLGYAVAVCDFNGDGRLDIAGGATLHEDRQAEPVRSNQGGVLIFLGYEDGFLEQPDQIVLGTRLTGEGEWSNYENLQLGAELHGGDLNGDNFCDLVVGANRYAVNGMGNAGAVFVFAGRPADGLSQGGVTPNAAQLIVNDSAAINSPSLGRRLAVDDMNGDGLVDIVVGENGGDTGGRDRGAVHLFLGHQFDAVQTTQSRSILTAEFAAYGNSNFDQMGIGMATGDVTGDGFPDLIVGAYVDDRPGLANCGVLSVYEGRAGDVPLPDPVRIIAGEAPETRLGEAIAVVSDFSGDGLADIVSHGNRASTTYPNGGQTFLITQTVPEEPEGGMDDPDAGIDDPDVGPPENVVPIDIHTPIDYPRTAAAARFGTGVAFVGDVTGDGFEDVIVTAPFSASPNRGSGSIWLYRGLPNGEITSDGESIGGFPNHTDGDRAWAVSPVGDFDGDGHNDFAVLLRDDERPNYSAMVRAPWMAPAPACVNASTCNAGWSCNDGSCRGPRQTRCQEDAECLAGQVCQDGDCRVPGQCRARGSATGGIYIYRGGPNIYTGAPSFAYWSPHSSNSPEVLSGQFDFNGDGYDDIVLGAYRYDGPLGNDAGSTYVITGRPFAQEAGEIQVICDTYYQYSGSQRGGNSGRAVVAMGDLNGDGCGEFALGSRTQDRDGVRDEGAVRIVFGFGAVGCPPAARMIRLATGEANGQAGWSLASGDLDGDGRPELAVGAWVRRTNNVPVGGVWVVPGTAFEEYQLKSVAVANSEPPELLNQWGREWLVQGQTRDSQMGYALAIAGEYLAVGIPQANSGETSRVGQVSLYRVTGDGVSNAPAAIMVGETDDPGSRLGRVLSSGSLGGQPAFATGADFGEATGLDNGSVYLIQLD